MKNEFGLRSQGAERPGNPNGLTPEALNQRLRGIGRSIILSAGTSVTSAATGLSMLSILGLKSFGPDTYTKLDGPTALVFVLGPAVTIIGSLVAGKAAQNSLTERERIIAAAVEKRYDVRGRFFKKIGPTSTA